MIRDHCHTNVSEKTILLDDVDVGLPKWHVCMHGLRDSMSDISNVQVHLRTGSGNVNIYLFQNMYKHINRLTLSHHSLQNYKRL